MKYLVLSVSLFALAACTSQAKLNSFADEPFVEAKVIDDPDAPVTVVELPKPLPLPGQLKKLPGKKKGETIEEIDDPLMRVDDANAKAMKEPVKAGYVNAIQVYPYSTGALYRLYAAVNQVSDVALQPGEKLVSVSTGDTVRWIVGDTTSGEGSLAQVHILVKPIAADLATNMVVTTERRTYHLELQSTETTYMSSLSWTYPADDLIAIHKKNEGLTGTDAIAVEGAETFDSSISATRSRARVRLHRHASLMTDPRSISSSRRHCRKAKPRHCLCKAQAASQPSSTTGSRATLISSTACSRWRNCVSVPNRKASSASSAPMLCSPSAASSSLTGERSDGRATTATRRHRASGQAKASAPHQSQGPDGWHGTSVPCPVGCCSCGT